MEETLRNMAERLLQKSMTANRLYWENTWQHFTELSSGRTPLTDWTQQGSRFWREAYGGMWRLGFQYAEDLLDLGIELTNTFYRSPQEAKDTEGKKKGTLPAPPEPLIIKLEGKPGDTLTSGFALNSKEPFAQRGRFAPASFLNIDTRKKAAIDLLFEPSEFDILPKEPLEIVMRVTIPAAVPPGRYRCPVQLEGLGDSQFEVILVVAAHPSPSTKKRPSTQKKKTNSQ